MPSATGDDARRPLPLWGVVKGRGKCRVLDYLGNDHFLLLTNRDHRILVHRDLITFSNR